MRRSVADDYLDFREFMVLDEAANILGLSNQEMFQLIEFYLESHIKTVDVRSEP